MFLSFLDLIDATWSKISVMSNGPGYVCTVCQYSSKNKRAVFEHVESKHVPGAGHNCPVCNQFCRSLNALRSHVVRRHGSSSVSKLSAVVAQCMRNDI